MKKSTIIARCLKNSNMVSRLDDAENRVLQVFIDEFPNENYSEWNIEVDDQYGERIISNVGRASRINVKMFIEDLWQERNKQ